MAWSGWRRPFIAALTSLLSIQAGSTAPASAAPAATSIVVDPSEAEPAPKRFASPSVGAPQSQPLGDTAELEDRRTESSRTFDNGDGTYTTELFTDPIHYRPDGDDDWQAIDIGFEPIDGARPESDLVAASTKAPVQVSIGANKRSDGFLVLEAGGRTYAISLTAADASRASLMAPAIDDARADWSDFLPGVDLRVIAGAEGAKTFLILDQPPATSQWTFLIDAPGLTAELAADGSVGFFDGKDQVAWIPAPYAVDSSNPTERGSGEMTDQVSLSVGQREGRISLTVRVEPDWLAKATYPVFVDPSFSEDFFPDSTTYGDAFVSTKYPTMNFADYVRP